MKPGTDLEDALFDAAARLTGTERAIFLSGACRGDPALGQRLEARLAAHDQASGSPSSVDAAGESAATVTDETTPTEEVGLFIGRYKLLEKLGEGGFGAVWLAEQKEPVRRKVALKVIKLGMDTKQVVARFEAERQALAMMDHPNIAKVLDAGTTDLGRPYFVMELVRGVRITEYCDHATLGTKDRLDLFIKVCQAIQHAHQKGIIHRDIKPSNVMVTLHDGVPVPKVIDFGIAKATQQELTDKTIHTQFQQFIGTPAYMSPEQAEMSGLDIDTRADIYSLGVLLYELLVGSTPFDAKDLMASGIDAMRKTIREKEPVRPSTRLATLGAAELTTTAKRRSADISKLLHQLKGDLDWIVMKCLEKDRTRRYETANGLAADLKRHLNNETVIARPPSASYRFQKAFRRNKLVFTAAATVAAALLVGISSSVWQAAQATRAKIQADASSQAAQASEQKARIAEADQSRLREQAEAQALAARRTAYNSEINLASQALAANNLGLARTLLNRQQPHPGQADLRGWEWRYLWGQTRADEHEAFFAGTNRIVTPLSFSGDGRLLAWVRGNMVVTDLISRRTVLERTNRWLPTFAHHAPLLASLEQVSPTNHAVVLLDITSQKETRLGTLTGSGDWAAFTPDDRRLLTVSHQPGARRLTAWNVASGERLWQRPLSSESWPYALSPDGDLFAAAIDGGRVQVLDMAGGNERFSVKATPENVFALTFSPDGKAILSGAGWTDLAIQIWDAHSGSNLGALEGHRSAVTGLIFTPDGTRLVSASADQTIRLWDWSVRKVSGILRGHLDEVEAIALASNGRTLASRCKDGTIYLWDITKPPRHLGYQILPSRLSRRAVRFTLDSQFVLGREPNGGVALWDAFTLKETRRLWGDSTDQTAVALSPDAERVVVADATGRLHVWDVPSGLENTNFIAAPGPFEVWFTGNGKSLLTSSFQRPGTNLVFETWNADTWQRKGSLAVESYGWAGGTTMSLPDSIAIVTDRTLRFLDVTKPNGAPKQIELAGRITGFALSPDGRTGAASSASGGGFVQFWNMTTLQLVDSFKGFLLGSHSVAFSPDGRRLAVGNNGHEAVKLWDAETRQELLTLSGEGSIFHTLEFSPDGRFLLAINTDGLTHLWSGPSWEEINAAEAKEKAESKQP